jgi:hypothetical protein
MGADVFLTRRQLLLQKFETTYSTDALPSHLNSYDAIRLVAPFTLDLGEDQIDIAGGNLSRGHQRPLVGIKRTGVTFRTYIQGTDQTTYTAQIKPPIGDLLRACGLVETFINSLPEIGVTTSGYKYAPSNDVASDSSVTIVAHQDGFEHRLTGCRGNVNFIWAADAPVIAEFNFRGLLKIEASTARAAPAGLPTATPPQWIDSGSIIVNSFMLNTENLNFSTNNTLYEEPASVAGSATGIAVVLVTERQPGGSFDPEATDPSTLNFFGAWRSASGTILKLNAGIVQGNRFTVVASQMVYKKVGWGDKQGLSIYSTNFELTERSSDDQFLLVFN